MTVRIHDISVTVSDTLPFWPGNPPFRRELAQAIERGDAANVSQISMGVHTATHVDAPVHFIHGAQGVDAIPLEALIGPCVVVEADPPGKELRPEDLPPGDVDRVLFKTRNSRHWRQGDSTFDRDFVALGAELANELVRRRMKLVGVDYLSVESFAAPAAHPVHRALLEGGVVPVEGLDLSGVKAGQYELFCLPVKLQGSDGAPARAVLIERGAI